MSTTTAPPINHRDDCPGGALTSSIGRLGDELERCTGCGRFRVVPPEPATTAPCSVPWSRYRCREHDHPVTWRGKGCPRCAEALRRRPKGWRRKPEPEPLEDA